VNITPISLGFMVDIPSYLMGGYKPTKKLGGHHLAGIKEDFKKPS